MSAASRHLPKVSALVVCFNSSDDIARCLDALLDQEVPGGLEIIVVDNASTDGTAEVLRRYAERVQVVLRDTNSGYAAANNEALALATGDMVALVNPDCAPDPGCLHELVDHLRTNPGVGMAAALLINPDGTPQLFARRDLTLRRSFWGFVELGERFDRRFLGGRHALERRYGDHWPPTAPLEVDCPAAACVLLSRALAGDRLFDERFPLLFNDADLHRRLRERSYRLEVVPRATAVHGYGTSLRQVVRARMRAERIASLRRYVARDWGVVRCAMLWLLLVLDGCFLTCTSIVGRKRGRDRALLRGTLGGLGLPGGSQPWLVRIPGPFGRSREVARRLRSQPRVVAARAGRWRRRRSFLLRLRYQAWRNQVDLHVSVHPTADIRHPIIELRPRRRSVVEIGARSTLREDVVLRLGGELVLGRGVDVRWGVVLNVKGRLELEDRCVVGRGASVHADALQHWGFGATVAEYCTILDTSHTFAAWPVSVLDQPIRVKPLSLGAGAFVGARATVMPGCSLGAGVRVGTGVVVSQPQPDFAVVLSSPAPRPPRASPSREEA